MLTELNTWIMGWDSNYYWDEDFGLCSFITIFYANGKTKYYYPT